MRWSIGCLVAGLTVALGCGGKDDPVEPDPSDTEFPSASISGPAAGAVTGVVVIQVTATDNVGVFRVRFEVNGVIAPGEDQTAPYSYTWDTDAVTAGTYEWRAIAEDAAGNATPTAAVTYTVGL